MNKLNADSTLYYLCLCYCKVAYLPANRDAYAEYYRVARTVFAATESIRERMFDGQCLERCRKYVGINS